MTQLCVVIFVLVLLIICLRVRAKSFTDYNNLFSPNNIKKTDDIILNYFLN